VRTRISLQHQQQEPAGSTQLAARLAKLKPLHRQPPAAKGIQKLQK
jgi:hypothetical protein